MLVDILAENIEYDIADMSSAGGTSLQGEVRLSLIHISEPTRPY